MGAMGAMGAIGAMQLGPGAAKGDRWVFSAGSQLCHWHDTRQGVIALLQKIICCIWSVFFLLSSFFLVFFPFSYRTGNVNSDNLPCITSISMDKHSGNDATTEPRPGR